MNKDIISTNAAKVIVAQTHFFIANNLPNDDENLIEGVLNGMYSHIAEWYTKNGKEYKPETEVIEDDAVMYAYACLQAEHDFALLTVALAFGIPASTLVNS